MSQERMPAQAESNERFSLKKSYRAKCAGYLTGTALVAGLHVFGGIASNEADQIEYKKAQEARLFDLNRAKITHVINLDKQEDESEKGIPIAMNE